MIQINHLKVIQAYIWSRIMCTLVFIPSFLTHVFFECLIDKNKCKSETNDNRVGLSFYIFSPLYISLIVYFCMRFDSKQMSFMYILFNLFIVQAGDIIFTLLYPNREIPVLISEVSRFLIISITK